MTDFDWFKFQLIKMNYLTPWIIWRVIDQFCKFKQILKIQIQKNP